MNIESKDVLARVADWSDEDRAELALIALEIEARRHGTYEATPAELAGIDRGLRDAAAGHFASDQDIEAVFAMFRRLS